MPTPIFCLMIIYFSFMVRKSKSIDSQVHLVSCTLFMGPRVNSISLYSLERCVMCWKESVKINYGTVRKFRWKKGLRKSESIVDGRDWRFEKWDSELGEKRYRIERNGQKLFGRLWSSWESMVPERERDIYIFIYIYIYIYRERERERVMRKWNSYIFWR